MKHTLLHPSTPSNCRRLDCPSIQTAAHARRHTFDRTQTAAARRLDLDRHARDLDRPAHDLDRLLRSLALLARACAARSAPSLRSVAGLAALGGPSVARSLAVARSTAGPLRRSLPSGRSLHRRAPPHPTPPRPPRVALARFARSRARGSLRSVASLRRGPRRAGGPLCRSLPSGRSLHWGASSLARRWRARPSGAAPSGASPFGLAVARLSAVAARVAVAPLRRLPPRGSPLLSFGFGGSWWWWWWWHFCYWGLGLAARYETQGPPKK